MNKLIGGSNSSVKIILLVGLGTTGYILIDLVKLNVRGFAFFFFLLLLLLSISSHEQVKVSFLKHNFK